MLEIKIVREIRKIINTKSKDIRNNKGKDITINDIQTGEITIEEIVGLTIKKDCINIKDIINGIDGIKKDVDPDIEMVNTTSIEMVS